MSDQKVARQGGPDSLSEVRRFLSRYDNSLGIAPAEPITLTQLNASVTAAHEAYQAARYEDVIAGLPQLLAGADGLHRTAEGPDRRDALLGYASAYAVAAKLLTKVGAGDLGLLSADRCAPARQIDPRSVPNPPRLTVATVRRGSADREEPGRGLPD